MATTSYSSLFGTNGAGQQGSRAGISTLFGQQAKPQETEEERQQRMQAQGQAPQGPRPVQPQQTFAQLQKQGMARPAPQAPQAQPFAQFGGSQQAQQARTGMLGALQQQLAQPTRFDTQAFQQIRQAQASQLGAEYQAEQSRLNEELARRGLSASSIGGGRMGDLAGQQARALAQLDAQLLQQAAQTQAQDRLAALQAGAQFAELAGSQDLAQFEANRVAQAAEFQQALQGAQFGQAQTEFERGQALQAAQAQQQGGLQGMELALREALGMGELTGEVGGRQTLASQQLAQQRTESAAERALREQLGLSEMAGVVYTRDAEGNLVPQQVEGEERQTLGARQLAQQQAQFTSQLGEQVLSRQAQTTQAQNELAFRQQLAQAEVTGNMDIPVLDATGKPTGQTKRVSSLAASRLGLEGTQLALQQAAQLSQQTGIAYTVGDDGRPTQLIDPTTKQPIRTESSAARLSQQELQQAELRGYIEAPDPANPGKTVKIDTLAAKNLNQQQLNFLAEQASQRSQQSGFVFGVNANGQVEQVVGSDGQPIRTESAAARLSQQELQKAEIRGYFEEPSPTDPTKKVPVSTVAAKQLTQQQMRDAIAQADAMSRQSGMQYEVTTDAQGNPKIEQMYARDKDGNRIMTQPLTTEAARAQQAQEADVDAERLLRERLGLAEISGVIYTQDPVTGAMVASTNQTIARQQLNQGRADALTQATGILHTVNEKNEVVPRTDASGNTISTAAVRQAELDRELRRTLGLGELTGMVGDQETLAAQQQAFNQQQQQNQLFIQLAGILAQSGSTGTAGFLNSLMAALGVPNANIQNQQDTAADERFERQRFVPPPVTTPTGTTRTAPMTTTTTTTRTSPRRGG